ncbi:rhodanese-like domain-containing protein [Vermiphilus pyriformis]|jgi:rhodanese-related sulfurtransferase|nr:MAG: rhodanese-like domain-containing protein [Vermiphilus pyriformis]
MDLLLINVLDDITHHECSIKGSINIPLKSFAAHAPTFAPDSTIIVYCASQDCPASRKAWHILNILGFINIYVYEQGLREWCKNGLPILGTCKADYIKSSHGRALPPDMTIRVISTQDLVDKLNIFKN